ncbi:type II toxin-antitoxin system Phd/YefM family antitoxin [Thauera sp.]|jgi:antitoxin (DNA-binding transcriptional repressor) of toxin-antitoxin stability system|uniref:type II toxin-antitoxin system Phd/YefM family antitoxin n=1 Tax=Thauera sp. TaxID=1905334 RepID=UPI002A37146A|nr:type II toxin-antitoxin system Phd/YefM family antitoxin [Thauera sp.]MDX9886684.1 type II toxin-antitoxin system Phd/YefM family antitoxin [Thauera sp.]
MKTASVAETKSDLSSLIADVEAGNDVLITRRGRAVARLVAEPGAARVLDRLEPLRREGLVISAWALTEMASVGGIKQRTGAIDAATRQQALAHFQRFVSADFRTAAVFIDASLALRAVDALHLASLDRRLNEAAVFHHIACEDMLA